MLNYTGKLAMVNKNSLFIDHTYQRELRKNVVVEIVKNFKWSVFSALTVYEGLDGKLYIVDGQHRWAASLEIDEILEVPCTIFKDVTAAKDFIRINGLRKAVSAIEKQRAQLAYSDPLAVKVQNLIVASGRVVGKSTNGHTVRCLFKLKKLVETHEEEVLRIWPVLLKVCAGQGLHEDLLSGFVYLERFAKHRISEKHWADRAIAIGADELHKAAISEARAYAKGGDKIWACGIRNRINKGLHNKLEFQESALMND